MRQSYVCLALLIGLLAPTARADFWEPQPIVVHEWGVETFDWSQGLAGRGRLVGQGDIPAYMYTDAHPGVPVAMPDKRVMDLPPDSGIRKKPVVYFYTVGESANPVPVGVELRFAEGHATAWFPQANVYRTPAEAATGQAPDLLAWKKNVNRFHSKGSWLVPDDTRMQLAWYRLSLSDNLPPGTKLPGADLPADHWAKVARDIPHAAYVSNGSEAEKYLFYEGGTREQAAVAIVPSPGSRGMNSSAGQIVNISEHTIYDLFAIYHSGANTWVGYVSSLEPMKPGGSSIATLALPDFTGPVPWTDSKALDDATTGRLLSVLTEGGTICPNPQERRDPADPQGPTACSRLFPDEASALEKIWHHDFFEPGAADGLTIVYRQSPESLDADMPLNIFTDKYHYISLSRCGLVLVSGIDVKAALQSMSQTYAASASDDPKVHADALAFLRQHRGMANGALSYHQRLDDSARYQSLRKEINAPG